MSLRSNSNSCACTVWPALGLIWSNKVGVAAVAEKTQGKAGRLAQSLLRMDLVILDELGYLPFSQACGALLFHLLSRLYEHTSVMITTNLDFAEWSSVFGDAKSKRGLEAALTKPG